MSFANMNPADRMKASGLIGLIVVILFFVVHIFLGAIAPKKGAANPADLTAPAGSAGTAAPPPPSAGPSATAVASGDSFPTEKIAGAKGHGLANTLALDIPDPFVQIKDNKDKPGAPTGPGKRLEPGVEMKPILDPVRPVGAVAPDTIPYGPGPQGTLPAPGGLLGPGVGPGPLSTAAIAHFRTEPEIKIVGLVDGDPPIATIQVSGRTTVAHRGDALASGYRVMDISPDGVVLRCGKELKTLRVGGILNEARPDAKQ